MSDPDQPQPQPHYHQVTLEEAADIVDCIDLAIQSLDNHTMVEMLVDLYTDEQIDALETRIARLKRLRRILGPRKPAALQDPPTGAPKGESSGLPESGLPESGLPERMTIEPES